VSRVAEKGALVTGAARGQGRSHAVRLAEEGADIIAFDVCEPIPVANYPMATREDLAETVSLVEKTGRRVISSVVDVRDGEALKTAVTAAVAELGHLDVVCANAGLCIAGTWDTVSTEAWATTLAVNLTGVWNTCVATIGHLIDSGGGSLIITSSYAGLRGAPFLAAYTASKHGVLGLARSLSNELADQGIRVNTVHPTGVSGTGMKVPDLFPLLGQNPKLANAYANALPVQFVEPTDVSNAVIYLASDESRYVTGVALPVDAGVTNH
jgi:SDR family mycofactocin-dependent oxidoreductase